MLQTRDGLVATTTWRRAVAGKHRRPERERHVLNESEGFPHVEKLTKEQLERLAAERQPTDEEKEGQR